MFDCGITPLKGRPRMTRRFSPVRMARPLYRFPGMQTTNRIRTAVQRLRDFNPLDLDENGRVGPPLLLWFLGVPGGVCILLWVFFFRGK